MSLRTALLSAIVLLPACSNESGASPHATDRNASDRTFDASALLDQGTKGLVVIGGNEKRPTYWDFDRVQYGAALRHVFRIENQEGRDVRILDLLPSCGCARAGVSYVDDRGETIVGQKGGDPVLVVPAGKTVELTVDIDTTVDIPRMNMDKLAQVRMRTDAPRAPYLTFELHLIVERTFLSVPAVVEFSEVPQRAGKSVRADVVHEVRGDGTRITGVESVEGPFEATVDATQQGDVPFWIVVARCKPGEPLGRALGKVRLAAVRSDGSTAPSFEIPLSAQIVPDVVARPNVFAFGTFERDATKSVSIEVEALEPGTEITFLGAEAEGAGADRFRFERAPIVATSAEPDATEPTAAQKWRISLTTGSDFPLGAFSGTLLVKLEHPNASELRVPYHGVAR